MNIRIFDEKIRSYINKLYFKTADSHFQVERCDDYDEDAEPEIIEFRIKWKDIKTTIMECQKLVSDILFISEIKKKYKGKFLKELEKEPYYYDVWEKYLKCLDDDELVQYKFEYVDSLIYDKTQLSEEEIAFHQETILNRIRNAEKRLNDSCYCYELICSSQIMFILSLDKVAEMHLGKMVDVEGFVDAFIINKCGEKI